MSLYHFQFLDSFCVCYNFVYVLSICIFMNWIPVHILQLLTIPPPLLHRLLRQHRENMGCCNEAAGCRIERSHELRDFSCVRLEREVLGVR